MAKLLEEIHPGEILLEDFMKPMGISARQLAADIDVSPSRISELVNGLRPITADTALRLGMFFGMEPRFWLNLQSEYDIRVADRELRAKLSPRIRVIRRAATAHAVADVGDPSPVSPTAECPSYHRERAPQIPASCDRHPRDSPRRRERNRSTDRQASQLSAPHRHRRVSRQMSDAGVRCRRRRPKASWKWSSGWWRRAVWRVEPVEGDCAARECVHQYAAIGSYPSSGNQMIREPSASVRPQIVVSNSVAAGRGVDKAPIPGVNGNVADSTALRKEHQIAHRHRPR